VPSTCECAALAGLCVQTATALCLRRTRERVTTFGAPERAAQHRGRGGEGPLGYPEGLQCTEVPRMRGLVKAQKIRTRLGGDVNIFSAFPKKPPGMHWRTYKRLRRTYVRLPKTVVYGVSWAGIRPNCHRRAQAECCANVINDNWIEWICTTPYQSQLDREWTCTTPCQSQLIEWTCTTPFNDS
jgi:hypothetical protein